MKTRNLSIIAGLILAIVFIPFVNAQVGDQNGIPPTESLAGILVGGVEYLAVSYDDILEIVAGDNITLDLDNTTGTLMINSTSLYRGMGDITYFNATVPYTEVISAISDGHTNTYVVAPPTDLNISHFFDMPSDGRLRYIGEITTDFHIGATFSVGLETGTNDRIVFSIHKNGAEINDGQIIRKIGSTNDLGAGAIHVMTELQQNDYIELYVGNMDATDNVEFHTLNIFALGSRHGFTGTQYGFLDSIHAIGNVTNTGCAEGEILSVQSGIFDCATAGAGGGETNTASNLSPGIGLFTTKSGVDLPFKSLGAGDGIILSQNATTVLINSTGSGGGETNTASNLNPGYGIFAQKNGVDLEFKSLINGSGIVITSNGTNIMLNSTSTRDQIYWSNVVLDNTDSALWLTWDGEVTGGGAFERQVQPMTKPVYLDYIEMYFTWNTIATGTYDFRLIDTAGTKPPGCSEHSIDLSTISAGDTVRTELDCSIPAGQAIFIDGECTTGTSCTSGQTAFSATLEYYAVNDAMDFPGWEYQDDNLGNHNATQNLDMNNYSIQNAGYIEMDGTAALGGSIRMASGDGINWRNSAGTNDNQVGFDSNDAFLMNYDGVTEYQFNTTDFTIATNNIKGSMGCSDNNLLDYNSATDRWECFDPSSLGGGGTQMMSIIPGGSVNVAKGVTLWFGLDSGATSTTASDVRMFMSKSGTASDLRCDVLSSTTNVGTTIDVAKNSVGTALDVLYSAGVTGVQTDLFDSITFAVGDWLEIVVINNSSGGGAKDFYLGHCSFMIEYD